MDVGVRLTARRPVFLASLLALMLVLAVPAAANADDMWSGASTVGPTWSDTGNWSGAVAPAPAAGTLTFPDLPTCTSAVSCYTSNNNLTSIAATGLVFSNTTAGTNYRILGNALSVGAGGITQDSGGATSVTINTPLALTAGQTWTVGSSAGSYNSLTLATPAAVTGSPSALAIGFPALPPPNVLPVHGAVFADSDTEVGPVTVTGLGALHIGAAPGSVNGSDGQPVALSGGAELVANPGAAVGPLSLTGASMLLGTTATNTATTTLAVDGAVSLDSSSVMTTFINDNGATPGTDFSQLHASGNISLAGTLNVGQGSNGAGTCVPLYRGDVATLVSTTGTLSGTFGNAPNGAILPMSSQSPSASCETPAPQVRITYTSNSVLATLVSGPTPPAPPTPAPPTPTPTPTPTPNPMPTPTPTPTPGGAASPTATTSAATHLTTTRAKLNGRITTGGSEVTWRFQYGRSTKYGRSTPSQTIAAGHSAPVSVSRSLSHLAPNVRYDFRLVVVSRSSPTASVATARGRHRTFITRATGALAVRAGGLSVTGATVRVTQKCESDVRCRGHLSITTRSRTGKHRVVLCASSSFSVGAHRSATVRARITPACSALLRTDAGHRFAATLVTRSQTGQLGLMRSVVVRRG